AIIIPTAVSWVVLGVVGIQAFAENGLINNLLRGIGLGGLQQNWLGSPYSALAAVAVTFVYSLVGINTLIFVTGMATIDPSIYESAKLDGGGWPQTFRYLTVPLLRRYFLFAFVVTSISAFSALFSLIYTMTGGGPNYGTTTIEFFIYQEAFATGAFGEGALLGIVLFLILFSITLTQLRLIRRDT
ncbi:binding-protein-dependent transport system inner membrane component, partial [mine drainage metagenome]